MRFDGITAVVTGAGAGIGRATATRLANEGAKLALIDINQESIDELAASLGESGCTANAYRADVCSSDAATAVIAQIAAEMGTPQVLVNNASVLRLASAAETPLELFDAVISTNLRSVFTFSQAVARLLIAAKLPGSIVNVSSIHAVISEPNASAYTAAKGGIEAMSRTFASEWASAGIRVNCVRPGATWSEMTTPIYTKEIQRAIAQRVPMGRIGDASEIAAGICFFASPDSSYCTGTTLDIDGGYIMDGSLPGTVYA
ncbi:SDR family NAD(P)-dependent oxidoreductase [Glaciibacter psychrotolerans]|uniref:NAD(P)-dependent dehydrogenase (Short-subunit alcohol dehydrogenase family) n=1 Tax=Glaciibacter psychrotolerans TaxID=670054 RepID=A0A7Z0EIU2_9MICO|nr:SDR family oxidoreductase [Leifsonia psychrotolerans]NYJ21662.1 NAD(P)-dependent dehydrogenase (short-subunit alcohol dehydrogenase family) [Leifsonia psychrotolerans]